MVKIHGYGFGKICLIRYSLFPPCLKSALGVKQVIDEASREGNIGVDFEFNPDGTPTVIGVASMGRCAAYWYSDDLGTYLLNTAGKYVAFAGIGADKPIIEGALGVKTKLDRWDDPMLRHWICNPDLASVPKTAGEDDNDPAVALGLMNLWCCTSLLHDVSNWKRCRKSSCVGPCPVHDVLFYCAVDAWAGLVDEYSLREQMAELGIPESYYEFRRELAEYCEEMQLKGVLVDRDVIDALDKAITSKKMTLFPHEMVTVTKTFKNGKTRDLKPKKVQIGPFNPNSPKAVCKWFSEHGIDLSDKGKPSASKPTVQRVLGKLLKPYGLEFNATLGEIDGDVPEDLELPEPLEILVKYAQKQCTGKGVKSWFDPQYIDKDNVVHPRFNVCGTSMGRLSSSKPNFQNIPRVGFGKEVRKAIVARPGYKLLSADFSQLEFRICLWFVGLDPNVADGAFEFLVDKSEGQFEEPATRLNWVPRDVGKSLVHGGDYMETLSIRSDEELNTPKAIGDRKAGALIVYDGTDGYPVWKYKGKTVCFTGVNLSERLFGDKTRVNRAKALKLQKIYLDAYPIRQFQMDLAKKVEASGDIRLPSGHRLPLYGRQEEDDLKQAAALLGQGGGGIYSQEGMLRLKREGKTMIMQVHDDYTFEVPISMTNEQCMEYLRSMVAPSELLPGFTCPAKVKVGLHWKSFDPKDPNELDMKEIGTLKYVTEVKEKAS